jgi:hypothetical protein
MKHQTAISIANWLRGLQNVISAVPVAVQIGHHTYSAGQYTENQNGVEEIRLYIVEEMPPFHNQMRRICYRTDDSGYDWHLIAWFRQKLACTEWQEVHRFGSHFILAQWLPVENWAADQCEKRPFRRIPMTIMHCDGPTDASVDQPHEEEEQ